MRNIGRKFLPHLLRLIGFRRIIAQNTDTGQLLVRRHRIKADIEDSSIRHRDGILGMAEALRLCKQLSDQIRIGKITDIFRISTIRSQQHLCGKIDAQNLSIGIRKHQALLDCL